MKTISNIITFLFIGFFIWIIYVVWVIFFSDGIVNIKPVSVEEFRTEVNYAYYNPEEKMIEKLYTSANSSVVTGSDIKPNPDYVARPWESIEAFDNLENSTSQRELKKEFEHLLDMYLRVENLYSKKELLKIKNSERIIEDYRNFYKILNIYIDYLQKNPNKENRKKLYKIVDKNLKNFYQLMRNSNNFIDYAVSLSHLEKFLESLPCSNNFVALFKQYPLIEYEIFFEKLRLSKQGYLKNWKSQLFNKQKGHVVFMEIMNTNHIYIDKMVNEIYRREMIALRDGSVEARKNHEEYVEKLKRQDGTFSQEFMELWNLSVKKKINIKYMIYIYVSIRGYQTKFHFYTYERYNHVNELHRKFLNGCGKK